MKDNFNTTWAKVSRIGLRDGEGIHNYREVILLNRLLVILPVVLLFYVPLEIFFNGLSMIPAVVIMQLLFLVPLPLHYFRYFKLAHYYLFFVGNLVITIAGLLVGKGIHNHVTLIPIVLLGIILFKTRLERILALAVSIGFFFSQHFLFDKIDPVIFVPMEAKTALSSVFFVLATVISFLVGTYFIGINREYENIVNNQKEALAIKNSEITASITYAKRIQNAILPPAEMIRELLPNSFILYKPKDIVAGDFYWLDKVNDTVLFAAADSTGHGVPGAMVSVVCNNALSRSVREFSLTSPSKILDKTREIIISEFEKSSEDVNDGMDISLCALDFKTGELQWAGANNPLLIISNNSITEIKPDKQPVGKFSNALPFTNHRLKVNKGDTIYIFSDGFADQFGGKEGKKLKYKVFKQLLLEHHNKPMMKQKESLDAFFEAWRKDNEQVDDICVMGLRI